ncbi:anticodon-binding protein [Thermoactinospora rubra]|uniref:anticodon-binding protein n=1 Tax=Thermoactinospora rubra TaxID=1088767 RepID=UPI000A0FA3DA|nr:anticodon-binding protein [Thermoactinospora rubra]
MRRLAALLGEPPVPEGTWAEEAVYLSAAALRRRVDPRELAGRIPGASVLPNGMLRIVVERPGELVEEVEPVRPPDEWPDLPRTWDNPGFVVRYGHVRACWTERWARDLGVPEGPFLPELLDHPLDRKVLRVLAELPARRLSRDPAWESYLVRLALAYHDAFECAPALPKGDEAIKPLHTARVRLAGAVSKVLPGPGWL